MIQLSSEARLTILLPTMNKALGEALRHATPDQLKTLSEGKDLKSLLNSAFHSALSGSKSNQTLLDLLKNGSVFKNMPPLADTLQTLTQELKNSPDTAAKTLRFEPFLKEIATMNTENLKNGLAQSGVFMESKFADALRKHPEFPASKELLADTFLKETMANDLKSNLLTLREELSRSNDPAAPRLIEQTDKLLTQIEYHQLLSYLGSENSIYFPFAWDQLEEGSLAFKKGEKEKFYCEIRLKLKEYGELTLMMGLYDKNQIEIHAHTQSDELKTLLHDRISQLRSLLISAGLTPRLIRISRPDEIQTRRTEAYRPSDDPQSLFEVSV
jgi:hypothetical protein